MTPPTASSSSATAATLHGQQQRIRFLLLDCCVTYHADRAPVIHLLGKCADGQRAHVRVLGFTNYFYADPSKVKQEDLLNEAGVVSVTECRRAPLFFHRQTGAMRDMYQVRYSFNDKKDKSKGGEGRFETDVKLRRRFMTERKLGAGCTVNCLLGTVITSEKAVMIEGEASYSEVSREDDARNEVSPAVLSTIAIDIQRSHNPKRTITSRCVPEKGDPIVAIACCSSSSSPVVFVLNDDDDDDGKDDNHNALKIDQELCAGTVVTKHSCRSESALIDAFQELVFKTDPDVIVGWDVVTHLEALGGLTTGWSRLDPNGMALKSKKVVNYSAAWVKRQNSRMSSTSNQQSVKLTEGMEGRVVIDLLRTTTTKHKMQRYSLAESIACFLWNNTTTQSSLRTPIAYAFEEFDQTTVSTLWRRKSEDSQEILHRRRSRVIAYCLGRALASLQLAKKQCLLEETLQAGSTALLTLNEVVYGAQMVRVHSLLQRKMFETDRISAGSADRASDAVLSDPINAPFLLDPIETGTQGLYLDEPVAVLDFASLYPSVIIAFNLCYSTYVHETDRGRFFGDALPPPRKTGSATPQLTMAPAYPDTLAVDRHVFATPQLGRGIVPDLLSDLIAQRTQVKQTMETLAKDDYQRVVLDQRQTQLKLSANATYGFIGASASPLQFVPVAESVLRWGQAICRRAVQTVQKQFPDCKVIYGQTDSLFIALGEKDTLSKQDAEAKANRIAEAITTSIGREPIRIKLEKIYSRLLLSGVNRYSGVRMSDNQLEIVGIESESRKECGMVRKAIRQFLQCVLVDRVDPFTHFLAKLIDHDVPRTLPSDLVLTHALWRNQVNGSSPSKSSATSSSTPTRGRASGASSTTTPQRGSRGSSTTTTSPMTGGGGDAENSGENQPHLQVAKRIAATDPDVSFVLGERVAFIFRSFPEATRQADKARAPFEDVETPPDLTLYVKHKLIPPLGRLARLVDSKRWLELESQWSRRSFTLSICPRGARKCLGKSGCRFLIKDSRALCERCEEQSLGGSSRAYWEGQCDETERRLFQLMRARQRGLYLEDCLGREYSALDVKHLINELESLQKLLAERSW